MAMGDHSAAASAAGYLYQVRWALLNLLREAPSRPDQVVRLEMHDDVSWEGLDGTATELLQTKLHAKSTAGLGNKDTDIWKTLFNWLSRPDATDPNGPELVLVTSSTAQVGTAAYALRPDATTRDVMVARAALTEAANDSTSVATEKGRAAFLKLSPAQRTSFLSRVRVVDASIPPGDLDAAVRQALTLGLPSGEKAQNRFVAELWRWWDGVTVDMLAGRRDGVAVSQLQAFLQELRDGYGPNSLWTTIRKEDVTEADVAQHSTGRFVEQMNLVEYPPANLRLAVIDYYRAITQETQWLDDGLIGLQVLRTFEDNLRDEWERAFNDMLDDLASEVGAGAYDPASIAEGVKVAAGKKLLRALLDSTKVSVRTSYDDPFFARGKRHELAHRDSDVGIGWHPDFADRLAALVAS